MLLLSRREVEELLDVDALIDALAAAMADVSAGRASMPPRGAAFVAEHGGLLAAMPGYAPGPGALVTKLVSLFPGNAGTAVPTHQAVIVAFDPADGRPVAVLDGTEITATRTAAGSALATRLLAREDARTLTIVGTGVQARSHARVVARARDFDDIVVAGRDPAKAQVLAEEIGVRAAESIEDACWGADVLCLTTHAADPVIDLAWLAPGTHVNSVGLDPAGREVDDATVAAAVVVVESREAVLAPPPAGAPDLLEPIERGLIGPDHIRAEIGELVDGVRPGRTSPEEITLYKSVGVAVQDAAAAELVLRAARERGVGREVEL